LSGGAASCLASDSIQGIKKMLWDAAGVRCISNPRRQLTKLEGIVWLIDLLFNGGGKPCPLAFSAF
jgi:hypothetical protein